jgi:hypothetical protein
MHERRIPGSRTALFRFLERHGITLKKVLHASEQERTDVTRARRRWIREQLILETCQNGRSLQHAMIARPKTTEPAPRSRKTLFGLIDTIH